MWKLMDAKTNEILLENVVSADSFWQRFKGLQFQGSLPQNTGLWLKPCSSLHTCFMRFTIDVIHLNAENAVLSVSRSLRPWRLHFCPSGTSSVIETMPGAVDFDSGTTVRLISENIES